MIWLEFQWVRSRTLLIVSLVVPTNRLICESFNSGWCFNSQAIASGLSPRFEMGTYFGPLLLLVGFGKLLFCNSKRADGSAAHLWISSRKLAVRYGSKPCIPIPTSPSAIA